MENTIRLRVYRRTLEMMVILWEKNKISDNFKVFVDGKEVKIKSGNTEIEDSFSPSTVVTLIPHEENNLDPYKEYIVSVKDLSNNKEYSIRVLPFGVLPEKENDFKKQHVQLFGWYEKERKWVKLSAVPTDEGFALAVKIIED